MRNRARNRIKLFPDSDSFGIIVIAPEIADLLNTAISKCTSGATIKKKYI